MLNITPFTCLRGVLPASQLVGWLASSVGSMRAVAQHALGMPGIASGPLQQLSSGRCLLSGRPLVFASGSQPTVHPASCRVSLSVCQAVTLAIIQSHLTPPLSAVTLDAGVKQPNTYEVSARCDLHEPMPATMHAAS